MKSITKYFFAFFCICIVGSFNVWGENVTAKSCNTPDCIASYPSLKKIINQQLSYYNNVIPEIYFIHLPNHDNWIESIMALELWLGYQATSLDFEHPPHLAQDLLYVTVARIQKMLLYGDSAAFLFKAGEQALSKRDVTCVITMNPELFVSDPLSSSAYLLALPPEVLEKILPENRLDNMTFFQFMIDHEVAHCLDSYFNGANPMSMKDYWGQYMHFQREIFSDTFAILRHISRHSVTSPFAKNMLVYRQLCLINGDPGCCSAEAIKNTITSKLDNIAELNVIQQLKIANNIRNSTKPDYNEFVKYYFASIDAMRELNISPDENYQPKNLADEQQLDHELILQLISRTRDTYKNLFREEMNIKNLN